MKLSLSTYNSTSITGYAAKLVEGPWLLEADIIDVPRVGDGPSFGGKSFKANMFTIAFTTRMDTDAHRNTDIEAILKLLNPKDLSLRALVALDTNDSNTPYFINCTAVKVLPIKGALLRIQMWAADPVWKKVTASTDTINASAGTTNKSITNNGNVDAYPIIKITPSATGGVYAYRQHSIIYNPSAFPEPHNPFNIAGASWDTAALVNDTSVSNQINQVAGVTAAAGQTCPVDTPVGGGLPASGMGYCGTEQFLFTIAAGVMTWVTRGYGGTTATTHADNAVIAISRITADGRDIKVLCNGIEIERWLGGMNTTTSRVWVVLDWIGKLEGTLQTALGSSGDTSIVFSNTAANIATLKGLPDRGMVFIDSECIAYTARNVTARSLTIADTGRAIKDTTAATHAVAATIRFIQYDLVILFGSSTASAPTQTDLFKPVFSLANSTNTNWRYDSADSVFADEAGLRGGAWKPSRPKGLYSNWYGGNQGTYGTDPITDMGADIVSYQAGTFYKIETAQIWWTLIHNGFTSISSLGEKWVYLTTTPWPVTRLLSSVNLATWVQEWSEAIPGSAATWTSWTHASESVPAGTRGLRFEMSGAVNAIASAEARNEVNLGSAGSMGVSFDSALVLQVTLKTRQSNAEINPTIRNNTTGDSLSVSFPVASGIPLYIDTDQRLVYYEDRLLAPPELSSVRQDWFRMAPGANSIDYVDATTGAAAILFTWNERKNA